MFQKLLWGALLLAAIDLALLELAAPGAGSEWRWRILGITLGVALLAVAGAWALSRGIARRIARLKASTEGLISGPVQIPPPEARDELGALAESLGRLARQMNALLDKVRLEGARRDAILTGMVEGVLAVDRELHVTFCNASFANAFGALGPVAPGLPVLRLVRNPEFLEMLRTVVASGESVKRRMQLAEADDRFFEVQAAPLGSGAMAILHDITDLERLERVRKDFVANVSHELRTPLTAIRGYAETLLDGALEEPQNRRRFVEVIQSHAIRLNNIASDLLTLSELESGRPPAVEPGRLSVLETLESAMHTVESEARMRQVQLGWGSVEDLQVLGNRIRLEQALVNLLDNAVKFNRPGGEVWVEARGMHDGVAAITISDNGIGIPSADLPRIFERFYRVDKTRSRQVGGTGLGLSIVKHVVEQMHGALSVESQLGKGSRFTVTLPLA
jgi:two-component system, OmpR family, phosphate regulon sensor histidine kinase PhoR